MPASKHQSSIDKLQLHAEGRGRATQLLAVGRRIVEKVRFATGLGVALAGAFHLLVAGVEISVRHI